MAYAVAEAEDRYRLASCRTRKMPVVEKLVEKHRGEPTLVIGQYLDQLDELPTGSGPRSSPARRR